MSSFDHEAPTSGPEKKGLLRFWKSGSPDPTPPDGGLIAWVQVLSSFLINMNNFGLANSFGVFQAFYETDLLRQHSSSDISWIGTLQLSLILIIGVVSGPLFDQGYFYMILIGSSITLVFALMMLSLATEYYQVMLTWGVLGGLCSGLLYIPSVSMIPLYFTSRRGLAIGIATAGGSFGGVIYPIVVRRLLDTAGFGWACRTIGFIALGTLAVAIVLMRPINQGVKKPMRKLFDRSIVKDLAFSTFAVVSFFMWLGYLVPYTLAPSFALTGLDEAAPADMAYYILAIPNVGQALGRILPGVVVDAKLIGPEAILMLNSTISGALALCWVAVHQLSGFAALLFFYGFFSGAVATMPAFIIPYLCPSMTVYGTRMGIVYGAAGFGALIGAPIALVVNSASDRPFLGTQLWNGLTILFSTAMSTYPLYQARKRRQAIEAKVKAAAVATAAEQTPNSDA